MPRRARRALPPGPPLPAPVQTLRIWSSPLAYLEAARRRYGTTFTVDITSHPPLVFLSDPGDIRSMLAAPACALHAGEGAETVEPLVGNRSFMLQEEESHLCGRRAVLPPLRSGAVARHSGFVTNLVEREVARWPHGTPVALHRPLRGLTLHTILRTVFGAPSPSRARDLDELHRRLLEMLTITGSAVFPEPLLRHGPGRRKWIRFLHRRAGVDGLLYRIIRERIRTCERSHDLLDELLHACNPDGSARSLAQVRDDVMSIVLAGHETTASQLAWAFQLLAHNPRVLERLTDELDTPGGERYLTATVKEVLRHRPVFLFAIPRAVKRPIEIGGFTYRPPAQLLACIYLLHHDPQLYPEPDEFRPERFLGSAQEMWLPWGGGRKRCPGAHLATLEIETVLRTVLASMTVRPATARLERPRWRSVIVTPHAGSRVVLGPRSPRRIGGDVSLGRASTDRQHPASCRRTE